MADAAPPAAPSPAATWDRLARLRAEAPIHAARARKVTVALGVACLLFVPVYCSTFHSGDYGPRATGETADVTRLGAAVGAALLAVIAVLRARALLAAARGLAILRALPAPAASDADRAELEHRATVRRELGDGVVPTSLVWVVLSVAGLVRLALALRAASPE
jgi:hypothetical protein